MYFNRLIMSTVMSLAAEYIFGTRMGVYPVQLQLTIVCESLQMRPP